ncbi:MAG: matrixin family metalloprotease [Nanoarchaeota archaeon]
MTIGDWILIFLVVVCLAVSGFLFYSQISAKTIEYKQFVSNVTVNMTNSSIQFYPNMRFSSSDLTYSLDSGCNENRKKSAIDAMKLLESEIPVTFTLGTENPEIIIECSSEEPEIAEKNHVIAGAAKPNNIINATKFFVIENSNISLYKDESCDRPLVALHEMLHAFGFDHNSNENSIMYPITSCEEEIDLDIINELKRLYSYASLPDVVIEKVVANSSGRYINFEIEIGNQGLIDAKNVQLDIVSSGESAKVYELEDIEVGRKKILSVQNIKVKDAENVEFRIIMNEGDLNMADNTAKLYS